MNKQATMFIPFQDKLQIPEYIMQSWHRQTTWDQYPIQGFMCNVFQCQEKRPSTNLCVWQQNARSANRKCSVVKHFQHW